MALTEGSGGGIESLPVVALVLTAVETSVVSFVALALSALILVLILVVLILVLVMLEISAASLASAILLSLFSLPITNYDLIPTILVTITQILAYMSRTVDYVV